MCEPKNKVNNELSLQLGSPILFYNAAGPLSFMIVFAVFHTVETRFNEPVLYWFNVLGISNDALQPDQSYCKMCGKEPRYNEILFVTNKFQHVTKDKFEKDQQELKSFNM